MKKKYLSPDTQVIQVPALQLLTESLPVLDLTITDTEDIL